MRHTLSALVENKFGVLARVAGMISGRGFNIDSLNVAPTQDPTLSRITIVLNGDEAALTLCVRQLQKLVNAVEVLDFKSHPPVCRELALIKVSGDGKHRPELLQICQAAGAKVLHSTSDAHLIEFTEEDDKVDAFLRKLEPFGILELARTGRLAIKR